MKKIKQLFQYIIDRPFDSVLYFIFGLAIIILYNLYFSVNVDDANWDKFRVEHDCKLLKSKYGTQKASWKCDDGKVYFRWMHQR